MADITDKKTYIVNDSTEKTIAFKFEDQTYKPGDEISLNDVQATYLIAAGFVKGATAKTTSATK